MATKKVTGTIKALDDKSGKIETYTVTMPLPSPAALIFLANIVVHASDLVYAKDSKVVKLSLISLKNALARDDVKVWVKAMGKYTPKPFVKM